MKPNKPNDLVKPTRPFLVGVNGKSRDQLKAELRKVLEARGFRIVSAKGTPEESSNQSEGVENGE